MDKKKRAKSKTAFWIAMSEIKKWITQPRMYVVLLAIFVFLWTQVQPVREYARSQQLSVSCWFFPFLFSQGICMLFLYFGLVLMYCNAPFIDQQQIFVILRSGKRKWFVGQILYIVFTSIIYFIVVAIISMLEFVPYLGFSKQWGTVIYEAVQNPTGTGTYLQISERVLENYQPYQAFFLIFFVNVGVGVLLGLLIFLVNLYKSRTYGSVIALIVIFVSDLISYIGDFGDWLKYISPVSWTDLSIYCRDFGNVSYGYVFVFLMTVDIVLVALIMRRSKSYSIEAVEEI